MMKALSLSQPWCWSMLDPIADKGIENRSWQPPISDIGTVFATPTGYFLHFGITHAPCRRDSYPAGAIVGVATLDRVVTESRTLPEDQRRWFFGPFGWVLTHRIALPTPIPCAGKQGFWYLTDELEAAVRAQLAQVAA